MQYNSTASKTKQQAQKPDSIDDKKRYSDVEKNSIIQGNLEVSYEKEEPQTREILNNICKLIINLKTSKTIFVYYEEGKENLKFGMTVMIM